MKLVIMKSKYIRKKRSKTGKMRYIYKEAQDRRKTTSGENIKEFVSRQIKSGIKEVRIDKLKPTISKPDKSTLSRFEEGIKTPIIVEKGSNLIEDGNHRYFGAINRGDKTIKVVYTDEIPIHNRKKIIEEIKSYLDKKSKGKIR